MDRPDTAFLNVERSLTEQRWVQRMTLPQAAQAQAMTDLDRANPILARVLAGRDVMHGGLDAFLAPTLRDLMPDPSVLTDMDAAVARIVAAMERGERVAIFGDYDVDGATSAALLHRFLVPLGVAVEIYIPDRVFEGYGPNPAAIRELVQRNARLIIAVDCGSNSAEALAVAKRAGCDVVVLDHHQIGEGAGEVEALVNPNRDDDLSGLGHLCAAGVVFLTLVALRRALRASGRIGADGGPDLRDWLDLVALGTVCDVVPLIGLNRAFVVRGMEAMRAGTNEGIAALARVASVSGTLAPFHLGFVLGPRINAGGRIGDPALGARLLTTEDATEAEALALRLDQLNAERQAMERAMLEQAIDEADAEIGLGDGPPVLVTANESWHAGVVGLLASRLKDRFRRPAFAIAYDGRGMGTGSGRSISGVDLGGTVRAAVEAGLLVKGGGHAMAAGITIEREKLGAFRSWLEDRLRADVAALSLASRVKVDAALSARGATVELHGELQRAGPFGAGNPQPVFAFPNHTLKDAQTVGANHVRFTLRAPDGGQVQGISFRTADAPLGQALLSRIGERLHFVGTLSADSFRGNERVQLRLIDLAVPEG
ncbi:single-stranded-DNA-specific exonuclease RecJ [Rhizobiaceae bacterium]|nr:single-stranded-DNA-specific exonuclease RecJ [Rhizobiaceae bacterium]